MSRPNRSGEIPSGTSIDEVAAELLKCGTEKWEGYTEAIFDVNGEVPDLHIELGQKFPELFPQVNEPLPWEKDYAEREGVEPVIFEGLPEAARFEVFRTDYRPRHDYDFYELTVALRYRSEHTGVWFLKIGKNSPDPSIFRTIVFPSRHEPEYEGQGTEFTRRADADQGFADIVAKYAGQLVI
jgi:hypothetical protein